MFSSNCQVWLEESEIAPYKHKNALLGRMRKQVDTKKPSRRATSQQHTCRNRSRRVQITTKVDARERNDNNLLRTLAIYQRTPHTPLIPNYYGSDMIFENRDAVTTRHQT